MVVPEQVQHGVDAEECRLPLKAVPELLCLLLCTLQRDNNVAQVPAESVHRRLVRFALVVKEREGEHVRRAVDAAEAQVQRPDALVVGKGERHLARVFVLLIVQCRLDGAPHEQLEPIGDGNLVLSVFKIDFQFPFSAVPHFFFSSPR